MSYLGMLAMLIIGWALGGYFRDRTWIAEASGIEEDPYYLTFVWVGHRKFYVTEVGNHKRIEVIYQDSLSSQRAQRFVAKSFGKEGPRVTTKEDGN